MILLNTEHGALNSLSLGVQPVTSHPDFSKDPEIPARETLDFAMPAQRAMEQFNEFKIVFQRAGRRMDKSAKLSIERFVLLPQ